MFEPSVKVSVPTCSSAAQHVKMIADTTVAAMRLRVERGFVTSGGSQFNALALTTARFSGESLVSRWCGTRVGERETK